MPASAIAPITGRFKNRVIRDLIGSSVLGVSVGALYWYGYHEPAFKKYRAYDEKVMKEVKEVKHHDHVIVSIYLY